MDDDVGKLVALGIDAALVGLLYYLYKSELKDAEAMQRAPCYSVQSDELYKALDEAPDNAIPYACVEGVVNAAGPLLRSQYTEQYGVIQRVLLIEHKVRRVQGFWSDTTRNLQDSMNTTAFQLVGPAQRNGVTGAVNGPAIDVLEVQSAQHIKDSLTTVYDVFEPTKDNFLSRSLDRLLFGEVTKGFQHKELMLHVGTPVVGIGRVVLSTNRNRINLGPCLDDRPYVLTTLTRHEVIQAVKNKAWALKFITLLFAGVGVGLAGYIAAKYFRKWNRNFQFTRRLAAVRQARTRENDLANDNVDNACVVCLVNQRDVIVLDCGHICLCSACCQALSEPASCPVCRSPVHRFLPVYIS